MITLKLRAGLGNQLFQYAYARALALRSKTDLRVDLNWFSNIAPGDTKRIFLLDKYNLPESVKIVDFPSASKLVRLFRKIKAKITREVFRYSDHTYYPRLAKPVHTDIGIEGFWNTEKYFKDFETIIRKELTLKNPLGDEAAHTALKINQYAEQGITPILIHVRRGDYVTSIGSVKLLGITGLEYYKKAIGTMLACVSGTSHFSGATHITDDRIVFILASDDATWVKENIPPLLNGMPYEIISGKTTIRDYDELHLMSLCHHFIITNSTYSWWSAWLSESAEKLGKNKIVIGPKQWIVNPRIDTKDVLPEDWIRV